MTKIEWTEKTWNPVTGCTKCSPGCENCYAEKMARRLQAMGQPKYRDGFNVTLQRDVLDEPLRWKKPRMVFVCSMGDLFHKEVPFYFVHEVMRAIHKAPQHVYQILTKRPERMADYFLTYRTPSYVWLGVTVCNQAEADEKIPVLLGIPATVRFVSVEPMLEPVDLTRWVFDSKKWYLAKCPTCNWIGSTELCGSGDYFAHDGCECPKCGHECDALSDNGLDWVICGGETGANARPMNPDWARALRDQCKVCGVPFFFKQMAKKQPIPDDLFIREFPKGGAR